MTAWVTEERSSEAYTRLCAHLDNGRQAYVVCPLVDGSETRLARAAEDEAERLRANELRGYRVGCVHGRLRTADRRAVMAAFTAGELDVLVATTVIEVGVDVPNATIMIVQEADRFGLAQLHQLRGRVGRGAEQSYCLLVSRHPDELSETATERLEAMTSTTDGFELAERDLEIRGEGPARGRATVGPDRPPVHAPARRPRPARAREGARRRGRGRGVPPGTPSSGSSARPSTSASPGGVQARRTLPAGRDADHRRDASGPEDRGAEG